MVGLARHLPAERVNTALRLPRLNSEQHLHQRTARRLLLDNTAHLPVDSLADLLLVDNLAGLLPVDSLAGPLKALLVDSMARLPAANTVHRQVERWFPKAVNTAWPPWAVPWVVA